MFGRKKQAPLIERMIVTRDVLVREDSCEAVQMRARHADYVEKATSEYVRLSARVNRELDRRDQGERHNASQADRDLGAMNAIADAIALITGDDRIIVGVRLDRASQARRGETFPYTSFTSGLHPIYPETV